MSGEGHQQSKPAPNQICETFAVRNASAIEPEVVMLASPRVPEPGAALASARERFVSPYVEVENYDETLLPLQLRQASLLDAAAQKLRLVAAE
jgi:hypothetical protein